MNVRAGIGALLLPHGGPGFHFPALSVTNNRICHYNHNPNIRSQAFRLASLLNFYVEMLQNTPVQLILAVQV